MVFGKAVEVEAVDVDRHGRTVAIVTVFKRLVNEELVSAGFAWVYTRYCDRPICERWKVQAAKEAITMKELFIKALEQYLKKVGG